MNSVKIILFFLIFSVEYSNCQTQPNQLVSREVYYWDELYNQDLFMEVTFNDSNYVVWEENNRLHEFYLGATNIEIIQYTCALSEKLNWKMEKKDTLIYYLFKVGSQYYRLDGFGYSDYLIFLFENNINHKLLMKQVSSFSEMRDICKLLKKISRTKKDSYCRIINILKLFGKEESSVYLIRPNPSVRMVIRTLR